MNYLEFTLSTLCPHLSGVPASDLQPPEVLGEALVAEILIAELSDWPFEGFAEEPGLLKAYIAEKSYFDDQEEILQWLQSRGLSFEVKTLEDLNWNAIWESSFDPIEVDGRCLIRAPFHTPHPGFDYSIEIMPKMSFGTGHHATTYLMVSEMLKISWGALCGVDMGSGTGVLAILAAKMGACAIDAIDIDEWAFENCRENILSNHVANRVTPHWGDAGLLMGKSYDFVLANINRNILLSDMESYNKTLSRGGRLILSGILTADLRAILSCCAALGLSPQNEQTREGWAVVHLKKE